VSDRVLNLYADDSGSRLPDRRQDQPPRRNWFGLGGLLVTQSDEDIVRQRYAEFTGRWPELTGPLHSVKIRNGTENFTWLRKDQKRAGEFLADLTELICGAPIVCIAAVIDRTGYLARYETMYTPDQRWSLCKTAFSVLIERSVKFAQTRNQRLRVMVERSDKKTDRRIQQHYDELKSKGMPFDKHNSGKYAPLDPAELSATLYEFRTKDKSSPLMQLADLCLYPICRYPYDPSYRSHRDLLVRGKLIDCVLKPEEIPARGIKYSCFDGGTGTPPPPAIA
jgi:hypothetical protein